MAIRIIVTSAGGFIGDYKEDGKMISPFQMAIRADKVGNRGIFLIPVVYSPEGGPIYFNAGQIIYQTKPTHEIEQAYEESKKSLTASLAGIHLATEMPRRAGMNN